MFVVKNYTTKPSLCQPFVEPSSPIQCNDCSNRQIISDAKQFANQIQMNNSGFKCD